MHIILFILYICKRAKSGCYFKNPIVVHPVEFGKQMRIGVCFIWLVEQEDFQEEDKRGSLGGGGKGGRERGRYKGIEGEMGWRERERERET